MSVKPSFRVKLSEYNPTNLQDLGASITPFLYPNGFDFNNVEF